MSVLERINSVGMAVQILDSISGEHEDLKNKTRAEIVKMLLHTEDGKPVGTHVGSASRGSNSRKK